MRRGMSRNCRTSSRCPRRNESLPALVFGYLCICVYVSGRHPTGPNVRIHKDTNTRIDEGWSLWNQAERAEGSPMTIQRTALLATLGAALILAPARAAEPAR